ncbi:MAG: Eco57I restriction-modification methylase domain-containing protein [Pyrinomonadaceae bacterium]
MEATVSDGIREVQQRLDHLKQELDSSRRKKEPPKTLESLERKLNDLKIHKQEGNEAAKHLEKLRNSSVKPFFLWRLHFLEVFQRKEGFDVVIGNPPYLFITELAEQQKRYLIRNYKTAEYRFDIYGLFIERAVSSQLCKGGCLSFITPHTLLSNDSYEKLRRLLLSETTLEQVIDLGPGVFGAAKNETMVLVLSNRRPSSEQVTQVIKTTATLFPKPTLAFDIDQLRWGKNSRAAWLVNISPLEFSLMLKFERAPFRLGELCTINQGLRTGDNDKYLAKDKKSGKWKPAAGGKHVGRYEPLPSGYYVYYEPKVLDAPRQRVIFESKAKLVIQEIRNITLRQRLVATYDSQQFFCLQSTNVVNLRNPEAQPSLKCLLGLLNSSSVNFFFRQRFPGNNHIPSNQLAQIPVPSTDRSCRTTFERLVDQMLAAKKERAAAEDDYEKRRLDQFCADLDREIDRLVYELYELTDDEIAIVEGSA